MNPGVLLGMMKARQRRRSPPILSLGGQFKVGSYLALEFLNLASTSEYIRLLSCAMQLELTDMHLGIF